MSFLMRSCALLLAGLVAACGSSDSGSNQNGESGTPTYTQDVQPILQAKCDPCHTTDGAGGFNHATDYEATQENSEVCAGMKVYQCMLMRVQNGSMPEDGDCTGDPAADANNARCLTAAEQDVLAGWVTAGAPEGPGGDHPPDTDFPEDPGDTGDPGGW
jgi:hypothetical protein